MPSYPPKLCSGTIFRLYLLRTILGSQVFRKPAKSKQNIILVWASYSIGSLNFLIWRSKPLTALTKINPKHTQLTNIIHQVITNANVNSWLFIIGCFSPCFLNSAEAIISKIYPKCLNQSHLLALLVGFTCFFCFSYVVLFKRLACGYIGYYRTNSF
jgi:hypothetical protein